MYFLIKILKSNFSVFKKGKKKSLGENDKNILDYFLPHLIFLL